jgi:8-oxo-dGTP diphosphatase
MAYTYDYPHPAVTVDIAVFTVEDDDLEVLLIRRAQEPFKNRWALPGGFIRLDESLRRAAWRELREETGVSAGFLEQIGAFGRPDRDPRERVISVAYFALLPADGLTIHAASDAREAKLFVFNDLPELAFDHTRMLRYARQRLKDKADDPSVILQLMPPEFTLTGLQRVFELILDRSLDKRNFRKRTDVLDRIEPTGGTRRDGPHRPAKLYRVR